VFGFKKKKPPSPVSRRPTARVRTTAPLRPHLAGLVYAIGDLHGRLDLFDELLKTIRGDADKLSSSERPTIVLLGDFVDRGPDSAGCIERALKLQSEDWCVVESLKGNHEEALMLFLDDVEVGPNWIKHGGGATLMSYGVDLAEAGLAEGWAGVQAAFQRKLPATHLAFFKSLRLVYQRDDYVFVHAGVRPGIALEKQSEEDLLWIRQEFLQVETACPGRVIVHGHTPAPAPEIKSGRINVDTGAYASGVLTAVRLRGFERTILQAR
jgi:serine/threonine protein phosphatase 1